MIAGFTAFMLIVYNGIIDKPRPTASRSASGSSRLLARAARRARDPTAGDPSRGGGQGEHRKPPGTV